MGLRWSVCTFWVVIYLAVGNVQGFAEQADEPVATENGIKSAEQLQSEGKYAEAIVFYKERLFTHSRTETAAKISECYERLGEFGQAIDFAEMAAPNNGEYQGRCGNDPSRINAALRKGRLLIQWGKLDEALAVIEPHMMASSAQYINKSVHYVPILVVEIYNRQGRLDELSTKVKAMRQDNTAREIEWKEAAAKKANLAGKEVRPLDPAKITGNSPPIQIAEEYISALVMAKKQDVQGLWDAHCKAVEKRSTMAFGLDFGEIGREEVIRLRAEQIVALGDLAKPLLLEELGKPSANQGWAAVLLAKMKTPGIGETVRRQFYSALGKNKRGASDESQELAARSRNFCYALAIVGDKESLAFLTKVSRNQQRDPYLADVAVKILAKLPEIREMQK